MTKRQIPTYVRECASLYPMPYPALGGSVGEDHATSEKPRQYDRLATQGSSQKPHGSLGGFFDLYYRKMV